MRRRRRKQTTGREETRLFFATDVHGSDRCYRKFLNAAKFYDANVLILGGDITGKMLIPVQRTSSGWNVRFRDNTYRDLGDAELAQMERQLRDVGTYPIRGTPEELLCLEDEAERQRVFVAAVVEQMSRWMELAEARLDGTGVRCLMAPGNDDHWEIDRVIQSSTTVEFAESRCIALEGGTEVITTGYSNETPWHTPREATEEELADRLQEMFRAVRDPGRLVLVAHPPPRATELDQAPAIDGEFRVQTDLGSPRMAPVGSSAVRSFIEEHQPVLGLHGHVHESKAIQRLGETVCVNPGSEYGDGVLCGAVIGLRDGTVARCQLVVG